MADFALAPPDPAVALTSGSESVQCGRDDSLSVRVGHCITESNRVSLWGLVMNVPLVVLAHVAMGTLPSAWSYL